MAAKHQAAHDIVNCLKAGALHSEIAARFPLDRIADAHEAVSSPRAPGLVLVVPDASDHAQGSN